jgi:hypothetical protein
MGIKRSHLCVDRIRFLCDSIVNESLHQQLLPLSSSRRTVLFDGCCLHFRRGHWCVARPRCWHSLHTRSPLNNCENANCTSLIPSLLEIGNRIFFVTELLLVLTVRLTLKSQAILACFNKTGTFRDFFGGRMGTRNVSLVESIQYSWTSNVLETAVGFGDLLTDGVSRIYCAFLLTSRRSLK